VSTEEEDGEETSINSKFIKKGIRYSYWVSGLDAGFITAKWGSLLGYMTCDQATFSM
jgi:hypothetical protein